MVLEAYYIVTGPGKPGSKVVLETYYIVTGPGKPGSKVVLEAWTPPHLPVAPTGQASGGRGGWLYGWV